MKAITAEQFGSALDKWRRSPEAAEFRRFLQGDQPVTGVGCRSEHDALPAPRDRSHYHQGDQPMKHEPIEGDPNARGAWSGGTGTVDTVERFPPVLEQIKRLDDCLDELGASLSELEGALALVLEPAAPAAAAPDIANEYRGSSETTRALANACERVLGYTVAVRRLRGRAEV